MKTPCQAAPVLVKRVTVRPWDADVLTDEKTCDAIVKAALDDLAALEKAGLGLAANGRAVKGAPIRTTPTEVLRTLEADGVRLRTSGHVRAIDVVTRVLESNGFTTRYESSKHFLYLGEPPPQKLFVAALKFYDGTERLWSVEADDLKAAKRAAARGWGYAVVSVSEHTTSADADPSLVGAS